MRRIIHPTQLPTLSGVRFIVLSSVVCFAAGFCSASNAADPLPSWYDGPSKKTVLDFVALVTDKNGKDYVEPADRIATFDNDGCCWIEKPLYIHLFANLDRFKELMEADPKLADRQPYKAIASKDLSFFMDLLEKGQLDTIVGDIFGVPFEGMSTDEFAKWNRNWLATWKHPRFKVGYRNLVYQPMVELIGYLRDNEFDVHLFTADEGAFLKLVATDLYGIPPSNVHGSSIKLRYEVNAGDPVLMRTADAKYLDNWDAKPRLIFQSIGKPSIFAAGNSNGDLHMLQWTAGQKTPSLALLIHHTDGDREYAYDKHTDKVMPLAREGGWTIVDMKNDWKEVFPPAK